MFSDVLYAPKFTAIDDIFAKIDADISQQADFKTDEKIGKFGFVVNVVSQRSYTMAAPIRQHIDDLIHQQEDSGRMRSYLEDFDQKALDHQLLIAHVPIEEIHREEKRQREERIAAEIEVRLRLSRSQSFGVMPCSKPGAMKSESGILPRRPRQRRSTWPKTLKIAIDEFVATLNITEASN